MTSSEKVRQLCLNLPRVYESHPFGPEVSVFKVRMPERSSKPDKMIALLWGGSDPGRVNLKCDPAFAEQLRHSHPQISPGYHMNKRHWNTVLCDDELSLQLLSELIEDSYDLVIDSLSRSERQALAFSIKVNND